ncbi:AhpA/YtjB family protein [Ferrimonas kyonanensis]|uniref:AhpA/YtjB family protein n=1 Tax=Ferrimonas kyonanensis TaxID=364763 RepID=UPI000412BCF7|nr:AhpA/YtjB family protein [Ferrimonas kyonanensis]
MAGTNTHIKISNKRLVVWRVLQVILAVTLMVVTLNLWRHHQHQGQQLLNQQAGELATQLVQYAAIGAAPALAKEDDQQLDWLVQQLIKDPRVLSASIFSDEGQRLAQAQSLFPESQLPEAEQLEAALKRYTPFVATIEQPTGTLGFIRIRVNTQLFFLDNRRLDRDQQRQQPLMLLMAGLVGYLLAKSLSAKRAAMSRLNRQKKAAPKGPPLSR